jgi:hypothetical protein
MPPAAADWSGRCAGSGADGPVRPSRAVGHQEQKDGFDLVEWLAARSFSTGKVGQMGVSYGGHTALLTAVNQPPHLIAVIAVQALSDWYENTIYRGVVPNARIREWQQATAPETLVENFVARPTRTWMVAGPWEHDMLPGQFEDIAAACYLAWWDHWLTDHPAPLPQAKVTSYEMPSHGWQQYPTWPPADFVPVSWSPEADGTLSPLGDAAPDTSSVARFEANKERLAFDANATLEPSASHTHMQNKSDTMYS